MQEDELTTENYCLTLQQTKISTVSLQTSGINTSYKDFNELLIEAAKEAATSPLRVDKSWFAYNKEILMPLIDERNGLLHQTRTSGLSPDELEVRKGKLRELQKYIQDQSRAAYEKYAQDLAEKISNMNFNPHAGWISVYTLAEGEAGHHKKPKTMAFMKSNGVLAQNDGENMEVLEPHLLTLLILFPTPRTHSSFG